jgi:hypothetical protein
MKCDKPYINKYQIMNFIDLAEQTISAISKPLTVNEMWEKSIELGLDKKLNSKGKTPSATLGARLYVEVRDNLNSKFVAVGKRPTRFGLKNTELSILCCNNPPKGLKLLGGFIH